MSGTLPILMYHQVSPRPHPRFGDYTVTCRAFRRQMRWLRRAGYESVGMEALLGWRAGARLPRRPVVITFDDGFAEAVEHAPPVLEEHGFRGVFFIVAGLVGQSSRWLVAETGTEFPLADWQALRRLVAHGHDCGAHTLTHPRLPQLPPDDSARELTGSRALLEENLEREIRDLAYPFGAHDDGTVALADAAGYRTAFTTASRRCSWQDGSLAMPRIHVAGRDSLPDFAVRVWYATSPGEWLRARASAVRKRARDRAARRDRRP